MKKLSVVRTKSMVCLDMEVRIGSGSVCNRQRLMESLKDAEQVNKFLHA